MNEPKISVVVPTAGRREVLHNCLFALNRQKFKDFEVTVVVPQEESIDGINDRYDSLNIRVVRQEARGLVGARNTGLNTSRGQIVSFIDDDVVVSEYWSQAIYDTFGNDSRIGGVSGPTIIPEDKIGNRDILGFQNKIKNGLFWKIIGRIYISLVLENSPFSIGRIFKSGAFSLGSNYAEFSALDSTFDVDYLEACNMSFRKSVLDQTGGFLGEYGGLGDWSEPDLAFRVREIGYRLVFNPAAAVLHDISKQGVYKERGRDSHQRTLNFLHFYFKWIKPNTPDKLIRFSFNLLFINMYWLYKFIESGSRYWLYGIIATFKGFEREICRL
jgi:GT2 family glycosyltransferase